MGRNLVLSLTGTSIIILLVLFISIYNNLKLKDIFPILISFIAIVISLFSLFKSHLLPARIEVISGSTIIFDGGRPQNYNPSIMLPITFINSGYGDCIIDLITLTMLTENGAELVYHPIAEIDLKEFFQGMRRIHGTNIVGVFFPFKLFGRESKNAVFQFSQQGFNEKEILNLEPGTYSCTVCARAKGDISLNQNVTFKVTLSEDTMKRLEEGKTYSITNYNL